MSTVLVFAGSNSRKSINKRLATYAASLLDSVEYEILDLNDYPLPIFSVDLEKEEGFPTNAQAFDIKLENCSGIILSLAENNGSYSAVFKNLLDWLSRISPKMFRNKPMLLMSTSPGGRGGASVMAAAMDRFPRHDANIIATFRLPSFDENFTENGIPDQNLEKNLIDNVREFEASL